MKVVALGGGTGLSTVLLGLRGIDDLVITAGCAASDNGGDTGTWVEEYGATGYIGDFMKCVLALCPMPDVVALNKYRVPFGTRKGQVVRNFNLVGAINALAQQQGGHERAFQAIFDWYQIKLHRVFPASVEPSTLVADVEVDEGEQSRIVMIEGQSQIALFHKQPNYDRTKQRVKNVFLKPQVNGFPPLIDAICEADIIVTAMGSLFTSIIPPLLPHGIKEAVSSSKAKIVSLLNLVLWDAETHNLQGIDFIDRIEAAMGRECDRILFSYGDKPVPKAIARRYQNEGAQMMSYLPLQYDEGKGSVLEHSHLDRRVCFAPLRTYEGGNIRHDPDLLRRAFRKLFCSLRCERNGRA